LREQQQPSPRQQPQAAAGSNARLASTWHAKWAAESEELPCGLGKSHVVDIVFDDTYLARKAAAAAAAAAASSAAASSAAAAAAPAASATT
jgi:hypothetical protein